MSVRVWTFRCGRSSLRCGAALLLVALPILGGCDRQPQAHKTSVIVLGFDGMEPRLTEKMMNEGRLPNFARLRDMGSFGPLQTVIPPQSPVAWATFATGLNPGGHGLFDFIHRDPNPPQPGPPISPYSAMARTVEDRPWYAKPFIAVLGEDIEWGDYNIPLVSARHELLRHGTPFWQYLTEAGVPAAVYRLPANFPSVHMQGVSFRALTDMGTPDLSDSVGGNFSFYTSKEDFNFRQEIGGGKAYPVQMINGMVLPERAVLTGTVKTVLSSTEFILPGWHALEPRIDGFAGCVAVASRGSGRGECIRAIRSLDPVTRTIALETPFDFELKAEALVKVFTPCKLYGPANTTVNAKEKPALEASWTAYVDPDQPAACIEIGGRRVVMREGEWSEWQPIEFPMAYGLTAPALLPPVPAMCRLYLRCVRPVFELYVSPINFDPFEPAITFCSPDNFSAEVAGAIGRYYTQGMPENFNALKSRVLTRDEFLQQADIVEEEREKLLDFALDHFQGGLLFFYYGGTDLVSHLFWGVRDPEHPGITDEERVKYADTVEHYYIDADVMLGRALDWAAENAPDAVIVAISDHGFETFSRGLNVNNWLQEHGFAKMGPFRPSEPLNINWAESRAYAMGINGIYVNLAGRESQGIVKPEDKQAVLDEITRKLLAEIDPKTGRHIVDTVYQSDRVYSGPYVKTLAPDLQVGYARGYRASWNTGLASFGDSVVEDNMDPWGADHCIATHLVPGIIVCNRPLTAQEPGLIDMASTILRRFGITPPATLEGRDVFE